MSEMNDESYNPGATTSAAVAIAVKKQDSLAFSNTQRQSTKEKDPVIAFSSSYNNSAV